MTASVRIVVLARGPWWLRMRHDRLATALASAGYEISGIVVERHPTRAALADWTGKLGARLVVRKGLDRLLGRKPGVSLDDRPETAARAFPVYRVGQHNSAECVALLRRLSPDLVVLRGARIIGPELLAIPRVGTLNAHYGKLPEFRGVDATEWAVFHGEQPMVSVHWVLRGVDTGAVVTSGVVAIEPGDTLGRLRDKSAVLARQLLVDSVRQITAAGLGPSAAPAAGRQFYKMHPRLRELAQRQLPRPSPSRA